ncbi:DNA/RNA endonuclease YhcR with UshA esterase domain [Virgibacillus halotolerans]|uniref:FIMAH domain-containing protein n=1 Tax=Virgibacillus halotolerans TaxID=1071053 RepID=UPI0019602BD3|nr:endonuclease [Virgibacillus halotolerans]MBM7601110.1 DNA/RNA endonuclease YhcR with UshA esterase domain [Virgibacillus halotolerans]
MKVRKVIQFLFAMMVVMMFSVFVHQTIDPAYAETVDDPAPHVEHEGELKGKVLFDNTHGETAGAADWVIDGAFSDFAHGIAQQGYDVDELRKDSAITLADLNDYDVFVLGESNNPFKASEQDVMLEYVRGGGSIFFIADHYNADRNLNRWDAGEVFNGYRRGAFEDPTKGMGEAEANSEAMQGVTSTDWLGENFGIRFRSNAIGDVTSGETVVPEDESFGVTKDVGVVEMHAGATLAILDPEHAKGLIYLPENPPKWGSAVDEGVYNGGGIDEGAFAAISKLGKGKAAFIGDSSPVEDATPKYLREENGTKKTTYDGFLGEGDNATFLIQTVEWLAEQEDYTSFEGEIPLSEKTPLKDFEEDPSKSTEPEPEPWSDPKDGYEWWNPSTFAPGSYGSDEKVSNPTYDFVHQEVLPNQSEFQIRLVVDDLLADETISNLKVGIYKPGGQQLATFKNEGGWDVDPGYSEAFNLTADATGQAHKDLTLKLNPDYAGDANLRLKVKGNNEKTISVSIDDVDVEALPPFETTVPDLVSIADARGVADGELVTVAGVITTTPGIWGGKGFYLQDETAGIYVFPSDGDFHKGQQVQISAKRTTFNHEKELEDIMKFTDKGDGEIMEPENVETVDDSNQGQLLKLNHVQVQNIGDSDAYGTFEFDAVNGDTTTRIRVDNRSGFAYNDFIKKYQEGDQLTITGIGSVFNDTYLLKPQSADDFAVVSEGATSALEIMETVEQLVQDGEFNGELVVRHLNIHLTAVADYEKVGKEAKVVKHMKGFKVLLDHYYSEQLMSEYAYQLLQADVKAVLQKWQEADVSDRAS